MKRDKAPDHEKQRQSVKSNSHCIAKMQKNESVPEVNGDSDSVSDQRAATREPADRGEQQDERCIEQENISLNRPRGGRRRRVAARAMLSAINVMPNPTTKCRLTPRWSRTQFTADRPATSKTNARRPCRASSACVA